MSAIDEGIKQPLRFYDTVDKQNWRRPWIPSGSGLSAEQLIINPVNTIIPFQIRRRRSPLPITVFDLWTIVDPSDIAFELNLFTIIPGPTSDHLRIIQMQQVDNIVWNPQKSFTSDLTCGMHYVHLSDGITHWYSEVFRVISGFDSAVKRRFSILPHAIGVTQSSAIAWTSGADHHELIMSHKPL